MFRVLATGQSDWNETLSNEALAPRPDPKKLLEAAEATGNEEIIKLARQQVYRGRGTNGNVGYLKEDTYLGQGHVSLEDMGWEFSEDLQWESTPNGSPNGGYDEASGPGLTGRFVQNRVGLPYGGSEPRTEDLEPQDLAVQAVVDELPLELADVYYAIFGEGLSEQQAADRLGISRGGVRGRVERIKARAKAALTETS